ncbi:MAG: HD domain-containing protein [Symbiobacteriia bacterium]
MNALEGDVPGPVEISQTALFNWLDGQGVEHMYPSYKDSTLWQTAFESPSGMHDEDSKKRLIVALEQFRDGAMVLAEEIPRHLPHFTDHSVHHLDALWHLASVIAGPDYPLSPLEAFVFGGAILLHDLGNAIVAFPGRLDDLKGDGWNDQVVASFLSTYGRRPSIEELVSPPEEIRVQVTTARLRDLHANAAQGLAVRGFAPAGNPTKRVYLLEDTELRDAFGDLIGRIASSHHWPIQRVEDEFARFKVGGPAWHGWEVDVLKIACLLRCADVIHLDMHRASTLQMALRNPLGVSYNHWTFQNRLHSPTLNATTNELEFRSTKSFGRADREAWWLAFDMLQNWADGELRAANKVLRRSNRPPFAAGGVAGVDSPEDFRKYVETSEWEPVDISVRITDVAAVIDRFGGTQLYGSDLTAPLRELIANAADAVRARRYVHDGGLDEQQGQIVVHLGDDVNGPWLEVEDEGIGMSEDVLRGPLLDFGSSFWGSALARRQFPGLMSSAFRPTGKFGIGFFSVFMLGAQVRVTTRRYDAANLDTQVLEITRGFKYPLLRRPDGGALEERVPRSGTRVRIQLDKDPWDKGGLVGEIPRKPDQSADSLIDVKLSRLRELVSRLAPALDVDVWVEIGGNPPKRVHAIRAADWQEMDFDQLLDRIGDRHQYGYRKLTNYVCEPRVNGQLLGRFRLTSDSYWARRTLAIGGLAARWNSEFLEGIVLGSNPQVDRNGGTLLLTNEQLVEQLQKAVDAGFLPGHSTSPKLANYLLQNGIIPKGLSCFEAEDGDFDMDALGSWAAELSPGSAVVLVEDDSFHFEDELGNSSGQSISEAWDHLVLEEPNLIVADRGGRVPSGTRWCPMEDVDIDWRPESGKRITLLELGVLTICRAWGVDIKDTNGSVDRRQVAHIVLRDDSTLPVEVNCFRLTRPK